MSCWSADPTLLPRLTAMLKDGASASEVAKALKLSRNQVIGKAQRMGLALRHEAAVRTSEPRRRARVAKVHKPVAPAPDVRAPAAPRRFSWEAPTP